MQSGLDGVPLGGKRAKILVRVLVSAGVLYLLFRQLDWQQASKILTSANLLWLVPPVLIMIIDRCWMAWKWRMLLAVLGPVPSLYDSVRVYFVSGFQGIAIPLGGLGPDIVRYAHLRSSELSRHSVAISIVMERAIGALATGIMAVLSGGILMQKIGVLGNANLLSAILLVGVGGSAVLGGSLFSSRIQKRVYRLLTRSRVLAENDTLERFARALREYRDVPEVILLNLVLALFEQLFPVLVFFLGSVAFQVPVTFTDCLAAVPISTLLERLPVSYAGLGVREGALVFLFGVLGVDYSGVLILSSAIFILVLITLLPGLLWSFDRTEYVTAKETESALDA